MKAYRFNIENGLYQSETFEEADMLQYVKGITTITPPLCEAGYVPVFDAAHDEWKVMPVSLVREQLSQGR